VIRLSVNVNKIATLRNSRGGDAPNVLDAVRVCLAAGAPGITVHPRADQRHIHPSDVREIAKLLAEPRKRGIEYNIEGDPRPDWLALVHELRPDQATLVPVREGEVTSEAGWGEKADTTRMRRAIGDLRSAGIRVSLFVNADAAAVEWAKRMGADRVELYTGPFATAFAQGAEPSRKLLAEHVTAAKRAASLGLGINAGHDLYLDNLVHYRAVPGLAEVSIGHALVGRALFVGLERVVREYLEVLA
jgi:pyridoxine 5-phosphate synthase